MSKSDDSVLKGDRESFGVLQLRSMIKRGIASQELCHSVNCSVQSGAGGRKDIMRAVNT